MVTDHVRLDTYGTIEGMGPPQKATTVGRERASQALQLRLAGATYEGIANQLGWANESGARHAVDRLLRSVEVEGADKLRVMEGRRLDRLQAAHWAAALGGDVDAGRFVLAVMARRAKLFGLDAPAAVTIEGGISDIEFGRQVVELLEALGTEPLRQLASSLLPGEAAPPVIDAVVEREPERDEEPWSNIVTSYVTAPHLEPELAPEPKDTEPDPIGPENEAPLQESRAPAPVVAVLRPRTPPPAYDPLAGLTTSRGERITSLPGQS